MLKYSKKEGIKSDEKINIAKRLKLMEMPVSKIAEITELTEQEINELDTE